MRIVVESGLRYASSRSDPMPGVRSKQGCAYGAEWTLCRDGSSRTPLHNQRSINTVCVPIQTIASRPDQSNISRPRLLMLVSGFGRSCQHASGNGDVRLEHRANRANNITGAITGISLSVSQATGPINEIFASLAHGRTSTGSSHALEAVMCSVDM